MTYQIHDERDTNMRVVAAAIKRGQLTVGPSTEKGKMFQDFSVALGAHDFANSCSCALRDFRFKGGSINEARWIFSKLIVEEDR